MSQLSKSSRLGHIFESTGSSIYLMLFLIILFGLVIRLAVFSGITGYDDMIYVQHIHKFSTGNFEPGSTHWSLRLGFILPVLLFVYIFGFNEIALILFPLICSIANIILIFYLAKLLLNEKIALGAAFLLSFFPLDVVFATMVFLDTPLSLFMGLLAFYFIKAEMQNKTEYYFISGLCLGLSYLTKLTGLYIFLFLTAYVISEKKFKVKYGLIILGFLLIFFAESGYYYIETGNPVYRFSIINKIQHGEEQQAKKENRVTQKVDADKSFFKGRDASGLKVLRGNNWYLEPIYTLTTNQEFGFFYYFVLPITIFLIFKKDKKVKILLIWMIPLLLYIMYGSTSPFHFAPLRRWPRYLTPITLPSLIILAYFLAEKKYWLWNKFSYLTISFLFLTSIICIFWFNSGPTDSYIVREVAKFVSQNSQKDTLVYWKMYQHLAPFLEYPKNQNVKVYGFSGKKKGFNYLGAGLTDPFKAKDSYIAIPTYCHLANPERNHPDWTLIHSIHRPKKLYCTVLASSSFDTLIPVGVKEKLCPDESCNIYYIP